MAGDTELIAEIYKAFETLGADSFLLGAVGSLRDTLDDPEMLKLLRQWNQEERASRPTRSIDQKKRSNN